MTDKGITDIEEEYIKTEYKGITLEEEDIKRIKKTIGFNRYMLGVYTNELIKVIDKQFKISYIVNKIVKMF